jgi:hypothetical protein
MEGENVGKKSRERMTGYSEEERIKNPAKIVHEDVKAFEKSLKRRRKQDNMTHSPILLSSEK